MGILQIHGDDVDALTSEGRVVHIRELRPDDLPDVRALHEHASDGAIYLRFFALDRTAARRYATQLVESDERRCALGAFRGTELVGVGAFEQTSDDAAEFALLVADPVQRNGIGTLLLEHLIAVARGRGVRRFLAVVLASNTSVLQVLHDLGFTPAQQTAYGQTDVEFSLEITDSVVSSISARDQSAEMASLRPLLEPSSVVVVGAGQRAGSVGHEVLRNILATGFSGSVHVVNPNRAEVLGVRCVPTPVALPEAPDLAIIALPASQVPETLRACGERGIRAAVLLGAGFGESGPDGAALQDHVLGIARAHSMRLVGPNCIGLLNTDPQVRLNATFARLRGRPGSLAVVSQSGAFGVALLAAADHVGLGAAQMVSIGNKIDVGGNDLLMAWDRDHRIRVIAAYLESIGDPRRFVRVARLVSRHKPVLVLKSGRTDAGRAAGRSHTAAAASSEIAVDALLRSSGVLRVATMRDMLAAARLLCDQPLPAGPRVVVVGNSGGPEILAADAVIDAGLSIATLDPDTCDALARLGVPQQNPLDLGATVRSAVVAEVLRLLVASPSVDAVLTVFTEVATTDSAALERAIDAASGDKPVVVVSMGASAGVRDLPGTPWRAPTFAFPEEAAAALGTAYRYTQSRARPSPMPLRPEDVDTAVARGLVENALDTGREWLSLDDAFRLLSSYRIPICPYEVVTEPHAAAAAARRLGYPLAAKLAAPGVHKTDVGGVWLGLADEASVRRAVTDLGARADGRVLLQPMITGGIELIAGTVHDPQCGPLIMLGAGGLHTDVLADRTFALAPLDPLGADELIIRLRSARLLDGYRGMPVVSRAAVRDVLIRLAALADDVPEIAELDVNPLIARADGLYGVDVRVRVATPPAHPDPLVRQLRGPRGPDSA